MATHLASGVPSGGSWVLSIPKADNPGNDKTGISSTLKQEGPVWFLVGTFENMQVAERTCHIPIGKAILFPVITSEKNNLEFPELKTELELRLRAKDAIDRVTNFSASIDGVKVEGLHNFRVQSPLFEVTFPENNIYEVLPSTVHTVSDGLLGHGKTSFNRQPPNPFLWGGKMPEGCFRV